MTKDTIGYPSPDYIISGFRLNPVTTTTTTRYPSPDYVKSGMASVTTTNTVTVTTTSDVITTTTVTAGQNTWTTTMSLNDQLFAAGAFLAAAGFVTMDVGAALLPAAIGGPLMMVGFVMGSCWGCDDNCHESPPATSCPSNSGDAPWTDGLALVE